MSCLYDINQAMEKFTEINTYREKRRRLIHFTYIKVSRSSAVVIRIVPSLYGGSYQCE